MGGGSLILFHAFTFSHFNMALKLLILHMKGTSHLEPRPQPGPGSSTTKNPVRSVSDLFWWSVSGHRIGSNVWLLTTKGPFAIRW